MHTFKEACALAKARSKEHGCVQHVNATLRLCEEMTNDLEMDYVPRIIGFEVSDWYGGSTVKSYNCGKELS